jgi:hypothetical protein
VRRLLVVCAVSIIAVAGVHAQSRVHFDHGSSARIPLDIDNNMIRMKMRINGSRPLMLIFDTGASVTGVHPRIIKELGLKTGEALEGDGTGGRIHANLVVDKVALGVEGVTAADQLIVSLPFETPPGFDFDGVIGYDFIKAFVVEIDYPNKTMMLFDPAKFVYRGRGTIVPLDLSNRRTPQLNALFTFGRSSSVIARLGLDTGADGAFLLNTPFVEKRRILETQKKAEARSAHGAGGIQQRLSGRASRVVIGGYTFSDVPIAFAQEKVGAGADTKEDGVVGGEVLRRFRVFIDYSRSRMILEPNKSLKEPIEVEDGE